MDGIVGHINELSSFVFEKCYNLGDVSTKGNYTGGICGGCSNDNITIKYTYNCGNISSIASYVGGIIGGADCGRVDYSYNLGNVSGKEYIGGICGYARKDRGAIRCTYDYNMGEISGERYVGGIHGNVKGKNEGAMYSCNIGKINGTVAYIGAIIGNNENNSSYTNDSCYEENSALYGIGGATLTSGSNGKTTKLPLKDMPEILSIINKNGAFVEDTEGINNGYPLLAWQVESAE